MNFLQRLVERLRRAYLAAQGFETGAVAPLPAPLVDPTLSTPQLVTEAEAQGVADAKAYTVDGWSFGAPGLAVSDLFDPGYVRQLRHHREVALATIRQYQSIAASRTAHVRRWRDETDGTMDSARSMMTGIAVREARLEELTVRRSRARTGVDVTAEDLPNVAPNDLQWEGETNPFGALWRLFIIAGLVLAEMPVQFFVYDYFLSGVASGDTIRALALSTGAFMVLGPHVAGLLLRARQATGAERRTGLVAAALAVPWLFLAGMLGTIRGAILTADPVRTERLHLTPVTIMLMFVALMLIVGAMSFMLGLARRHPFQEAFVRQRGRRDRLDTLRRGMAERINPAYRDPDEAGLALLAEDERAVRESYAAAEEAYFAALARTVGDPVFTEAVQQRRGPRPAVGGSDPPAASPVAAATAEPGVRGRGNTEAE